ncbi:ribulokinase, partial [Candidatus Sumerlaeota bacterium]|nr:ribulokinase [Candidatus Sumerlaeota bacterium]
MAGKYSIGLDYGTNSARCLVVRAADGAEVGTSVFNYPTGEAGIIQDRANPELARQHPGDYIEALVQTVPKALAQARENDREFAPDRVIGIGVDATASTPMPIDAAGQPLTNHAKFAQNPNAMAWLWKDHTSIDEAAEITRRAAEQHPEYLAKCGGTYSSEWFFSKIWHCLKCDPEVFRAAHTWVEIADWIPALLCDTHEPEKIKAGICGAGHKGMYHEDWGGYPARDFLAGLAPELGVLRDRLPKKAHPADQAAGKLSAGWGEKFDLPAGIPVAIGVIDAHQGAVGAGIRPGTLVKIMGTSTCDMMVWPLDRHIPDIPGVCGIVPGSIVPGCYGIEAGQSAVGDIFNWFVNSMQPGGAELGSHEALAERAAALRPGESGLLALDWNNGNRCVLVDQRLTGLILGQTLHTRPEEIYRALIEATAFGALMIIRRLEEYKVEINEIVNCGGIAEKSPLTMQIYADITGRPMKLSRSAQTCALGSALCGAVVAGSAAGGYDSFGEATRN